MQRRSRSIMASIYRRMLTFEGCSFGERTKRGLFISFGAKETNQRKHSPHQGLPSRGGCNRSSCRSYTNVSSTHHRVGIFLSTTLDAGRYGCGSSIVLIIYAILSSLRWKAAKPSGINTGGIRGEEPLLLLIMTQPLFIGVGGE